MAVHCRKALKHEGKFVEMERHATCTIMDTLSKAVIPFKHEIVMFLTDKLSAMESLAKGHEVRQRCDDATTCPMARRTA